MQRRRFLQVAALGCVGMSQVRAQTGSHVGFYMDIREHDVCIG